MVTVNGSPRSAREEQWTELHGITVLHLQSDHNTGNGITSKKPRLRGRRRQFLTPPIPFGDTSKRRLVFFVDKEFKQIRQSLLPSWPTHRVVRSTVNTD